MTTDDAPLSPKPQADDRGNSAHGQKMLRPLKIFALCLALVSLAFAYRCGVSGGCGARPTLPVFGLSDLTVGEAKVRPDFHHGLYSNRKLLKKASKLKSRLELTVQTMRKQLVALEGIKAEQETTNS